MTAQEWIESKFNVESGRFGPMPTYTASADFFVNTFGPTLEAALAANKSGQDLHDALMATPGGTRGWNIYFDDWLKRGILG